MTSIVYWANLSQFSNESMKPKPLLKDLSELQSEHKGNNWLACPAITTRHKNTFMTTIPYNCFIDFKEGRILDNNISQRPGLYKNSYAFDWNFKRIFFSDKPQIMEVSPAFLHKLSYSQFGHAPSGAFDIGQWFRPSSPTFQLWSGETEFKADQGEAHLYFNFPNNDKVILQQFNMSEKLIDIMYFCVNYKSYVPKQSLHSIYQVFLQNKLKNKILIEIKQNLIL
jgi:hypothetical protein